MLGYEHEKRIADETLGGQTANLRDATGAFLGAARGVLLGGPLVCRVRIWWALRGLRKWLALTTQLTDRLL